MNQNHTVNVFHLNADVSLMVENLIQRKNRLTISVNVRVKNQWNIAYAKKVMPRILAYVGVSAIRIVRFANT